MDRQEYVLAVLAPARGASHTPVQVQKLFFLLDKEASHLIDGPRFSFEPYHYGPFDISVYNELNVLQEQGLVEAIDNGRWTSYRLSSEGQAQGDIALAHLPGAAQEYIAKVSDFVRSLSFSQLVRAVYAAYPEMKANSVFQG